MIRNASIQRQVLEGSTLIVAVRIVEGYRSARMVDTAFGWGWDPTLVSLGFWSIPAFQGTERVGRVLGDLALHATPATERRWSSIKKYFHDRALVFHIHYARNSDSLDLPRWQGD